MPEKPQRLADGDQFIRTSSLVESFERLISRSLPSVEVAVGEDVGSWVEKLTDLCGQPVSDPFGQTPGVMEKGLTKPGVLLFASKIQPKNGTALKFIIEQLFRHLGTENIPNELTV